MLRRLWNAFSCCGLLIVGGLWIGALTTANGVTVGVAQQQGWLVCANISGNGSAIIRQFDSNPTDRRGIYIKKSSAPGSNRFDWKMLWPHKVLSRNSRAWAVHLLLPLTLFMILSTHSTFIPLWRRHRRRRLHKCVACGYDLRGSQEPRCPECGVEAKHIGA